MRVSLHLKALVVIAFLVVIGQIGVTYGQSVTVYKVQINSDNSASWTIIQALNSNSTVDSWLGFQQRINTIVNAAVIQTQRNMSIDPNTFQMTLQEASVKYQFTWLNFSANRSEIIVFGDVFDLNNFFGNFYGEGIIQFTYPSNFVIQSVSPPPNQRDDTQYTLEWLSTQNFATGKPTVTLIASPSIASPTPNQTSNIGGVQIFAIALTGSATIIVAVFVSLYLMRWRRQQRSVSKIDTGSAPLIESEEEKILKIVRSNGGQIFQSAVTEQSRFSKAKASQLLSMLEKKGIVIRYKKGRDKIVTLTEKGKGGSP
jgi:uncharacterized membrane protein